MRLIECPTLGFDIDLDLVKAHSGWDEAAAAWSLLAKERKLVGNDLDSYAASRVADDCRAVAEALRKDGK